MTENHPITPPLKLMQQWADKQDFPTFEDIATQAARWGADQELEACCEWLRSKDILEPAIDALRAARRPKPPSLAEQAMEAQQRAWNGSSTHADWELIRAALERLQKLEQQLD